MIRRTARLLLGLLPLILAAACTDTEAPEKCEDLVEAVCANAEDHCMPPLDAEECIEQSYEDLDCDEAVAVEDTYEDCMDTIEHSEECLASEGLPEDCEGVILSLE